MSRTNRILKFDNQAREKLLEGVNILADAVGCTLGPRGQNVAIGQPSGYPKVIHDGVTVAGNIDITDPFADVGVQLIKEAAEKTNDTAGDGTTTATILAQSIINEAMSHIKAGINPMLLKHEIEAACVEVFASLEKLKKEINKNEEIEQIAAIASADAEIGRIVSQAMSTVGKRGNIIIEEGNALDTVVEYKEGMEIDRGYLSPYFVTDTKTVEAIVKEPYILLTDMKLSHNFHIIKFMEMFHNTGNKNLVIFAGEVIEEALATLVINRLRGGWKIIAVQSPAFGGRRIDELEDIAAVVGGQVIAEEKGRKLDSVTMEDLGRSEKVISDRDTTKIINGWGKRSDVKRRIKEIESQLEVANTDYDRDIKQARLANLAGKVAVLMIGAVTDVEMSDKKERVIDAVNATKAAVSDGVLAGGQIALLHIASLPFWDGKWGLGGKILQDALKMPFKRLLENSGLDYAELWNKVRYPVGIDVTDGKVKDLIKAGIIDPYKVVKSALENSISVASMAITTKVLIADAPKDEQT